MERDFAYKWQDPIQNHHKPLPTQIKKIKEKDKKY